MVLILQVVNVVYHTDGFADIEKSLHPWDKSHLIMVDNPFNIFLDLFIYLFIYFAIFWAAPVAYGGSRARGRIGAVAASLRQSHSNTGSELRLRPTPQLMATPDS